ncbi:unnamed protein product [Agarophyton chilense]|eukprot:gb/GEZJ01001021.1/.p1 GENE.gb/GEZJ01001021.1/~~gb/GEZJ01001021.1/.p1  ORF type:complete len:621 (-),score=111.22 gb/GEZJ01001021.1/:89-1951(-)
MIDAFVIFERGGTVLWRRSYVPLKGDPVAALVRHVLLAERLSQGEFEYHSYALQWTLDNARALVYVVIFQSKLRARYAAHLLRLARRQFAPRSPSVDVGADYSAFGKVFDHLVTAAEHAAMPDAATRNTNRAGAGGDGTNNSNGRGGESRDDADKVQHTPSSEDMQSARRASVARRLQQQHGGARKARKSRAGRGGVKADATEAPKTRVKKMRPSTKLRAEQAGALDFSKRAQTRKGGDDGDGHDNDDDDEDDDDDARLEQFRQRYLPAEVAGGGEPGSNKQHTALSDVEEAEWEVDDVDDDTDDEHDERYGQGVFSYFKGLGGGRKLSRAELQPALKQFRDFLVEKNVAQEMAEQLMESVGASVSGRATGSLRSVRATVRQAVAEALTRTLTARQGGELLTEIAAKRARGQTPYVVAFCGVNGVGKSTSVAKTCYYLREHGLRVMLAACDTFRAGAVEQLRTHARCLGADVELFERGYGGDAAEVAAAAVRRARQTQVDVLLVDTAGRMQHNEPLMRALAKLVRLNRPDRVLFVGEALAGNDAVHQLRTFDGALRDLGGDGRGVDGVVLTKFDAVGDKVGAAVSLVYATGLPIDFVGVGQTYTDLRRVDARSLVNALLR